MKLESHFVSGMVIGIALAVPHSWMSFTLISVTAILGSVLPDFPIIIQAKIDDWQNRERFSTEREGTFLFFLKECSHSPLMWAIPAFCIAGNWSHTQRLALLALSLGIFSHWFIDVLTHIGAEFADTDQSLIWPFRYLFPEVKLGQEIRNLGLGWEYRYNYKKPDPSLLHGLFDTKPPEQIFQKTTVLLWILLVLIKFYPLA